METTDTWITTEYVLKVFTGKSIPQKHSALGLLSLIVSDSPALPEERQWIFY